MDYRKFIVENLEGTERVDKYLTKAILESDEEITRSELKKYFEEGNVKINDLVIKPSYKVKNGEEIIVYNREIEPLTLVKEDIPLNIVYEDDDVVIINKPSGMVVHPGVGHTRGTLVNALLFHIDSL